MEVICSGKYYSEQLLESLRFSVYFSIINVVLFLIDIQGFIIYTVQLQLMGFNAILRCVQVKNHTHTLHLF